MTFFIRDVEACGDTGSSSTCWWVPPMNDWCCSGYSGVYWYANGGCTAGYYKCYACAAGKYGEAETNVCYNCAEGRYSGSAATVCSWCPDGWYADGTGNSGCTKCGAGKYLQWIDKPEAEYRVSSNCNDCPAGKYEQDDRVNCKNCPSGKYSTGGWSSCATWTSSCGSGKYQSVSPTDKLNRACASCSAGQYQNQNSHTSTSCTSCGAGKYSLAGWANCADCNAGRYGSGGSTSATCTGGCAAGQYSLAGASGCINCNAGRYGSGGSTSATCTGECAAGKYSLAGASSCTDCLAGKYSLAGASSCTDCLAGKYSLAGWANCADCNAGKYTGPGSSSCTDCPVGQYSMAVAGGCSTCNAGYYQNEKGQPSCKECSEKYQDQYGQTGCKTCTAGNYLTGASFELMGTGECDTGDRELRMFEGNGDNPCTGDHYDCRQRCADACSNKKIPLHDTGSGGWATFNSVDFLIATTGTGRCFCVDSDYATCGKYKNHHAYKTYKFGEGYKSCKSCPAGWFQGNANKPNCEMCAPGSITNTATTGGTTCTLCAAGLYSTQAIVDSQTTCASCQPGQYSLAGSTGCTECDFGYFEANAGSPGCKQCPAGYRADNVVGQTSCAQCSLGTYTENPGYYDSSSCPNCDGQVNSARTKCYPDCRVTGDGGTKNTAECYCDASNTQSGSEAYFAPSTHKGANCKDKYCVGEECVDRCTTNGHFSGKCTCIEQDKTILGGGIWELCNDEFCSETGYCLAKNTCTRNDNVAVTTTTTRCRCKNTLDCYGPKGCTSATDYLYYNTALSTENSNTDRFAFRIIEGENQGHAQTSESDCITKCELWGGTATWGSNVCVCKKCPEWGEYCQGSSSFSVNDGICWPACKQSNYAGNAWSKTEENCMCSTNPGGSGQKSECNAGKYCHGATGTKLGLCSSAPPCNWQNGLTINRNTCSCGNCDVDVSNTDVLCDDSSGGTCSPITDCAYTNGEFFNRKDCKCGSNTCSKSGGKPREMMCDDKGSVKKCRDIEDCPHFLIDGESSIENKGICKCGTAICSLAHNEDGDCDPIRSAIPGVSDTPGVCTGNGLMCDKAGNAGNGLCTKPQVCSKIEEGASIWEGDLNKKTCECGTTKCSTSNTEYCEIVPKLSINNFLGKNVNLVVKNCENWLIYWPDGKEACQTGTSGNDCTIFSGDQKKVCEKSKECFYDKKDTGFSDSGDGYTCQVGQCFPTRTCRNQKAINPNNELCTCGIKECAVGQYCDYLNSQCLDFPMCTNKAGLNLNPSDCYCKNDMCTGVETTSSGKCENGYPLSVGEKDNGWLISAGSPTIHSSICEEECRKDRECIAISKQKGKDSSGYIDYVYKDNNNDKKVVCMVGRYRTYEDVADIANCRTKCNEEKELCNEIHFDSLSKICRTYSYCDIYSVPADSVNICDTNRKPSESWCPDIETRPRCTKHRTCDGPLVDTDKYQHTIIARGRYCDITDENSYCFETPRCNVVTNTDNAADVATETCRCGKPNLYGEHITLSGEPTVCKKDQFCVDDGSGPLCVNRPCESDTWNYPFDCTCTKDGDLATSSSCTKNTGWFCKFNLDSKTTGCGQDQCSVKNAVNTDKPIVNSDTSSDNKCPKDWIFGFNAKDTENSKFGTGTTNKRQNFEECTNVDDSTYCGLEHYYIRIDSGKCSNPITTVSECLKASKNLEFENREYTSATIIDSYSLVQVPSGCYETDTGLVFNTKSNGVDCSSTNQCLCKSDNICDGCICGDFQCNVNEHCYIDGTKFPNGLCSEVNTCQNVDGLQKNDDTCWCGVNKCSPGNYCLESNSQCAPFWPYPGDGSPPEDGSPPGSTCAVNEYVETFVYKDDSECMDWTTKHFKVCSTNLDGSSCSVKAKTFETCKQKCTEHASCGEFYYKDHVCFLADGVCYNQETPTNPQSHYVKLNFLHRTYKKATTCDTGWEQIATGNECTNAGHILVESTVFSGGKCKSGTNKVCKRISPHGCAIYPTCKISASGESNEVTCRCGNTNTCKPGQYCFSDGICADGPMCEQKDGLTANAENCRCGELGESWSLCIGEENRCMPSRSKKCYYKNCANIQRQEANPEHCECRLNTEPSYTCDAKNSPFCQLSSKTCHRGPLCTYTNGAFSNYLSLSSEICECEQPVNYCPADKLLNADETGYNKCSSSANPPIIYMHDATSVITYGGTTDFTDIVSDAITTTLQINSGYLFAYVGDDDTTYYRYGKPNTLLAREITCSGVLDYWYYDTSDTPPSTNPYKITNANDQGHEQPSQNYCTQRCNKWGGISKWEQCSGTTPDACDKAWCTCKKCSGEYNIYKIDTKYIKENAKCSSNDLALEAYENKGVFAEKIQRCSDQCRNYKDGFSIYNDNTNERYGECICCKNIENSVSTTWDKYKWVAHNTGESCNMLQDCLYDWCTPEDESNALLTQNIECDNGNWCTRQDEVNGLCNRDDRCLACEEQCSANPFCNAINIENSGILSCKQLSVCSGEKTDGTTTLRKKEIRTNYCNKAQPFCNVGECSDAPYCGNKDMTVEHQSNCYCGLRQTSSKKKYYEHMRGKCSSGSTQQPNQDTLHKCAVKCDSFSGVKGFSYNKDTRECYCDTADVTTCTFQRENIKIIRYIYKENTNGETGEVCDSAKPYCWSEGAVGSCTNTPKCPGSMGTAQSLDTCKCGDISCGLGDFCYDQYDCQKDSNDPNIPSCGCLAQVIPECDDIGDQRNGKTRVVNTCACNKFVCPSGSFCNWEFSMCDANDKIPSCDTQGININSCLCGNNKCNTDENGFYCDAKTNQCTSGKCGDNIKGIAAQNRFCAVENYGNGFLPEELCKGTSCEKSVDYSSCCKFCDKFYYKGKCVDKCPTENFCYDKRNPSNPLTPFIRPNAVVSTEGTSYTGYCSDRECLESEDRDECCIPRPHCKEQNPVICDANPMYIREMNDIYCADFQDNINSNPCSIERCCKKVECTCTGGVAAYGYDCPKDGMEWCTSCDSTHWETEQGTCSPITIINTQTQYIYKLHTRTSDNVVKNLTQCTTIEWISKHHNNTSDRECSPLTQCARQTHAEKKEPTMENGFYVTDRECELLIQCGPFQYETGHEEGKQIECTNFEDCPDGQYGVKPPGGKTNRICHDWTTCSNNEYQTVEPTSWLNRKCLPLKQCNAATEYESNPDRDHKTDRECQKLTNCNNLQYESNPDRDHKTDRTCAFLHNCTNLQYESNADRDHKTDRTCETLTICGENEYITKTHTETSNRICTPCDFKGCKGCMEPKDCYYNELSRINTTCSGKQCDTINITHNNKHYVFSPPPPLTYGKSFRFVVRDIGGRVFKFENSPTVWHWTQANTVLTSKNPMLMSNHEFGISEPGDILSFTINEDYNGLIQYTHNDETFGIDIQKDCRYEYNRWSSCSQRCGDGVKIGFLNIIQQPTYQGETCPTLKIKTEPCKGEICDIDCDGTWSEWLCDVDCGKGNQTRTFTMVTNYSYQGKRCPESPEKKPCEMPFKNGKCDCDGHVNDGCGICGGDNSTCVDCSGVLFGTTKPDKCGVCGGDGSTCGTRLKILKKQFRNNTSNLRPWIPIISASCILVFMGLVFLCLKIYDDNSRKKRNRRKATKVKSDLTVNFI